MKINKKTTILVEDIEDTLDNIPAQEVVDLDQASGLEVASDILKGIEEAGLEADVEEVVEESEVIKNLAKIIRNPYGTARLSAVEDVLQMSLDATISDIEAGLVEMGAFQNVIIYGLAGFGKTAKIKQFCKDHKLNLFECDAKSLDSATVGGIPYPKKNKQGEYVQSPIASNYWDGLNKPNTILYLDEINRAHGAIRGTLLTLINEHTLPMTIEDPKTGEVKNTKFFENLLFTVISINPADDIFEDNQKLDPAEVSRNVAVIEQGPDIRDYLSHLTRIYTAIERNPYLDANFKTRYMGQFEIAKALLSDKSFAFDDTDDVRQIYYDDSRVGNYLNYRTFYSLLRRCDGTKNHYLKAVKYSGLSDAKQLMIKNILATYTDKITTGNSIFNTSTSKVRSAKAAQEIEAILANLEKSFE